MKTKGRSFRSFLIGSAVISMGVWGMTTMLLFAGQGPGTEAVQQNEQTSGGGVATGLFDCHYPEIGGE